MYNRRLPLHFFIKDIFILMIFVGALYAQTGESSTLFSFINQTYDAQAIGRGGISSVGKGDKGRYIRGNPALAAEVDVANFVLGFQPYGFETFTGFLGGSIKLSSGVVISPLLHYITYSHEIPYDSLGNELEGAIAPFGIIGGVSAAYQWDNTLFVGGTFSVAYEKLTSDLDYGAIEGVSGTAFLLDLGMMYRVKKLTAASGVRNLGFWTGYGSEYEDLWKLPTSLYASMLWSFTSTIPVGFYFETEKRITSYLLFRGAFEFSFKRDVFFFRLGSSISLDELKEMGNALSNGSNSVYDYSKRDWQIFSFGFNVSVPVQQKKIFFDFALGFRADGIDPQLAFSGGLDF